jgi:hypothetical protein
MDSLALTAPMTTDRNTAMCRAGECRCVCRAHLTSRLKFTGPSRLHCARPSRLHCARPSRPCSVMTFGCCLLRSANVLARTVPLGAESYNPHSRLITEMVLEEELAT